MTDANVAGSFVTNVEQSGGSVTVQCFRVTRYIGFSHEASIITMGWEVILHGYQWSRRTGTLRLPITKT